MRNQKKIHLTESQLDRLITERISENIYHFTSISNALKISQDDAIYLQSSLEGYANASKGSKLFYLSTTRTKYQSFGYSKKFSDNAARIELDGDRLNNRFTSKPYHYWGDDMGKPTYMKNDGKGLTRDKQEHVRDEAEDRLFSHEEVIEPAHKYIKRIDIILTDTSENNRANYLDVRNLLLSKYNRIVFVYDNLDDFNKQTDRTINRSIMDDFNSSGFGNYNHSDYRKMDDVVKVILAAILNGETDNPLRDSATLLKNYGLERYIKNGTIKGNEYFNYPYSFDFERLADTLSYKLETLSKYPNRERSRMLKMITDYFRKNNLRNYKDFIKYKSLNSELQDDYRIIQKYIDKGYIDPERKIKALLIRNTETYDKVIVTDVNKVNVSDINSDLKDVAETFINYTEENMKSDNYSSYRRYIMNVFRKNPTIGHVMEMLKGLGYEDNIFEMLQIILNTQIEEKTLDVYSLSYNMVMPKSIHDKKYNVTQFMSLFKK